MSLHCDVNTLEDGEHSKSKRNTCLTSCSYELAFLLLCIFHRVYITVQRHAHAFYIAYIKHTGSDKNRLFGEHKL